jgi:hypothetical protein
MKLGFLRQHLPADDVQEELLQIRLNIGSNNQQGRK